MRHHDLVVLGSGSGNSLVDERFADLDVAIVEHGTFGGTCLNVGCIPTKMYVYPADVALGVRHASRYGVDAHVDGVRWADIRDRVFGRIDPISAGGREYRLGPRTPNVTLYEGRARFTGPKQVRVESVPEWSGPEDGRADGTATATEIAEFTADRVVVATGSRPVVPEPIVASGVPFHTSDTIMRLAEQPRRLLIVGGGYIAAEFAHVFSALGTHVTLVARGDMLLRDQDETVSERFTAAVADRWECHLGREVATARHDASGVELELTDGTRLSGDALLVATGRRPNTDLLDVEKAGLTTHPDGRLVVDEFQRTEVEGVYAMGDVSSPFQLKHVANHETKVVAHNLTHPDDLRRSDHRFVPWAVFTSPQIAGVGATEAELRAAGVDYAVKVQAYGDVAYGWAMEDQTGFCKVLAERGTGRLLGAHVVGPQASSLLQPLIQAMSFGLAAREMAVGQYWIHPGLPEVVENALLGLDL